jgi:hypothetical protein
MAPPQEPRFLSTMLAFPHAGKLIDSPKSKATPDQKLWKEELQRRGYKAVIARGYSACLDAIKDYFSEDHLDLEC